MNTIRAPCRLIEDCHLKGQTVKSSNEQKLEEKSFIPEELGFHLLD